MCGRYTLVRLNDILEKFAWIEHGPPDLVPRYNIAPTQPLLAICNDNPRDFDHLTWGLIPSWAKDVSIGNKMINARAETLVEKPSFARALRRRRCLIIADGFYEWQQIPGEKRKQPMLIRMKDGKPFAFAGLWDWWHHANGSGVKSCTIITTAPNELMKLIHDRMPAIVPPDRYLDWVEPGEMPADQLLDMLGPYPANDMTAQPVSTLVNSPKNELPGCIEPVEKETLF